MRSAVPALSCALLLVMAQSCGHERDIAPTAPDRRTEARDGEGDKPGSFGVGCPTAHPAQYILSIASSLDIQLEGLDPDADPLEFAIVQPPIHGTAVLEKNGLVKYQRTIGYCGEDSFQFTVSDGQCVSDPAEIAIELNCCSDPVHLDIETEMNIPVIFQVTATDPDGDPLTFEVYVEPDFGTAVIDAQGHGTYTPNAGYCGPDRIVFVSRDGHCMSLEDIDVMVCPVHDGDEDGVPDEDDTCPDSDVRETIWIDGCDTGVPNGSGGAVDDTGCSTADIVHNAIEEARAHAGNHGEFVSGFQRLLKALVRAGVISRQHAGEITTCAAQGGYEQ